MADERNLSQLIMALENIHQELLLAQPEALRLWSLTEHMKSSRGILVVGPRGVGKTTQLLEAAHRAGKFLYFSADNPLVSTVSLSEIASAAFGCGYEGVVIDEVHGSRDWALHLKSIYDSNPRKMVWASDSSSLVLREGTADLSRRFPRVETPLLSFREYLALSGAGVFPVCSFLKPDVKDVLGIVKSINVLDAFNIHLAAGMRPLFVEGSYGVRILATLEKSLLHDVPFFVSSITEKHLRLMRATIGHLARSTIPTINVEALCRDWGVGKEKLYQLLDVLEHAGVLNIVRYQNDKKVLSKGAKMYLADPSLYAQLNGDVANLREAYVVAMSLREGCTIFACQDETQGDFVINDLIVEVGGRSKKAKQAELVIRDNVEIPSGKVIPLWMLGFQS